MAVRKRLSRRIGYDITWPTVVLLVLGIAVVGALIVAASTSAAGFGLYNPSWDGTSEFRSGIDSDPTTELTVTESTTQYPTDETAGETVAFIIAPDHPYETAAAVRVREFVERGGTVVVLDNAEANANPLLDDLGAEARLDGQLLLDEQEYDQGPAMPIATPVENRTEDIDRITLNVGTAVEPSNASVLVTSSDFSYLADSEDDEVDDDSELTAHPVVITESIGDGEVVVIGDPSMIINAMLEKSDNEQFIASTYDGADHVLIDWSHGDAIPPLVALGGTIRRTVGLQLLLGTAAIGGLALAMSPRLEDHRTVIRRRYRSIVGEQQGPPELSVDELKAVLSDERPELDEQHVQRVIAAFNNARSKGDEQ